jgi:hypothetical protein
LGIEHKIEEFTQKESSAGFVHMFVTIAANRIITTWVTC